MCILEIKILKRQMLAIKGAVRHYSTVISAARDLKR